MRRDLSSPQRLWLLSGLLCFGMSSTVVAEGITETPNTCSDGGQGLECDADQDCSDNSLATVCITADAEDSAAKRCQIPCGAVDQQDTPDSSFCSAGEVCTKTDAVYHCKPTKFTMDINLLDHCIQHFLNGVDPSITDSPTCSLESHLNRMLDQTGDLGFDIFDMDLCIKSFVTQEGCDPGTETCEREIDTFCSAEPSIDSLGRDCSADEDCEEGSLCSEGTCEHGCGDGGYCDVDRYRCTRDCGTVFVRGIGQELTALDRQCFGRLTQCNYERGRCDPISLDSTYCEVDQECPAGAYCLMGECAPKCSNNLDCPGSDWYCAVNNNCRPIPLPPSEEGFVFEPTNYSVQFGTKVVELDEIQSEVEVSLLMMDLETRERVIDNPAVVFGYRMKVTYQLKGDTKCLQGPNDITCSELADCTIEPDQGEGFVTMEQPVGTIFASANPSLRFMLNQSATDILSTGAYSARIEMFLNNGARTSFLLTYSKKSLSGQYVGTLEPYLRDPDNGLGLHSMTMDLAMAPSADAADDGEVPTEGCVDDSGAPPAAEVTHPENWNALLEAEGLGEEATMIDTFSGTWVQGSIDGNSTALFDWPTAQNRTDNRIPVKGFYDEGLGQVRLIGIIDLPSGYCQGEEGDCDPDDENELKIDNLFERPIRRLFQFIGTFDLLNKRYSGIYREKVSGLSPNAFTLEGTFNLSQTTQDEVAVLPAMGPLATLSATGVGGEIAFPEAATVEAALDADILLYCGADGASTEHDEAKNHFSSVGSYGTYVTGHVVTDITDTYETTGSQQIPYNDCTTVQLGDDAGYFNRVHATIQADTSATSDAWIYFRDRDDEQVGNVHFQPHNQGTSTTGDSPILWAESQWVESYRLCSWWSPSTLQSLQLEYVDPNWGAGRVFLDGQTFNQRVSSALVALGNSDTSAVVANSALTIQDFLQGQAGVCEAGDIDDPLSCVDESRVACGLALYRKAVIDELFTTPTDSIGDNGDELFCEAHDERENCRGSDPALIGYQEHNRFYQELSQAYSYSAQNELSDALFTVVRNAVGALESYNAFGYKETKLHNALKQYDNLRKLIYSPVSARVLHMWPMGIFKTRGRSWLDQMHNVSEQRLDALADLIDLKRRLWANVDSQDFTFVHHLMHEEYLAQVFLMHLQKEWEGDQFTYLGEGATVLERGNDIIRQVDEKRNPLGLPKNQIFFETNHVNTRNWKFYRGLIMDGPPGAGLLADTENAIEMAMENLQASLQSRQEFESAILEQRQQFTETLDQICGAPTAMSTGCHKWSADQFKTAVNCTTADCGDLTAEWNCPGTDNDCGNPYATITSSVTGLSCSTENPHYTIDFEQPCSTDADCGEAGLVCKKSGSQLVGMCARHCVNGDVGGQIMELQALKNQRQRIAGQLKRHMKTMKREFDALQGAITDQEARNQETRILNAALWLADTAVTTIEVVENASEKVIDAIGCEIIAGFAVGTDCPQKFASGAIGTAGVTAGGIAKAAIAVGKQYGQALYDKSMMQYDLQQQEREAALAVRNMMGQLGGLLDEHAEVEYQINQVKSSTGDLLYLAEQAKVRYQENTAEVIDHLIGNESGNVLHRNAYVQDASNNFDELIRTAYKMVMAMGHTYNLKGAPQPHNLETLINRLYQMLTPGDVADFIAELDYLEATYCGQEGIDCDASANGNVFRFSVREQLFPQLRDLVDRHTGTVLTKGEQFHNIITSAPFLKRRTRSGVATVVEQIEIPFGVWLYEQDSAGLEDGWMLSPFECNHLVGHDYTEDSPALNEGVIAAYYEGRNLQGLKYELWRGHTDYIRNCRPETVTPPGGGVPMLQYPVNVYTVGYAPQSLQAEASNAPTLVTHTSYLAACPYDASSGTTAELTQEHAGEHGCFNFFARDRSLAAPDWRLVVPIGYGSGNDWVMNDGVPSEDRAVIDDIVLYFRYRSRPLGDL